MSSSKEPWPQDMLDTAIRLWKDGMSGTEVGQIIGKSRNAVLGKMHRLGLCDGKKPAGRRVVVAARKARAEKVEKPKAAKSKAQKKLKRPNWRTPANKGMHWHRRGLNDNSSTFALTSAPVPDIVDPPGKYTLMDLDKDMCKWPVGDPTSSDFGFCGDPRVEGRPYCACHARRANIPLTKSQKRNIERAVILAKAA